MRHAGSSEVARITGEYRTVTATAMGSKRAAH
jgi:hypothetical protein